MLSKGWLSLIDEPPRTADRVEQLYKLVSTQYNVWLQPYKGLGGCSLIGIK